MVNESKSYPAMYSINMIRNSNLLPLEEAMYSKSKDGTINYRHLISSRIQLPNLTEQCRCRLQHTGICAKSISVTTPPTFKSPDITATVPLRCKISFMILLFSTSRLFSFYVILLA